MALEAKRSPAKRSKQEAWAHDQSDKKRKKKQNNAIALGQREAGREV